MLRRLFQLILLGSVLATLAAWIISVEMAETWVFTRTRDPQSALKTSERLWLIRVLAPVLVMGAGFGLRRWLQTEQQLRTLAREFLAATRLSDARTTSMSARSVVCRVAIAAWLLLSLMHWEAGIRKAIHEWPIYEWASGELVLPNMSSSNRDVIRSIRGATQTEEDARILCLSDQTLYFVSYYAWPRKILHRTHPDSEFVVPQEGLSQRRAAYRLSDFTEDQLADWAPDYVLEYYASPEYVDQDPLEYDPRMVAYLRLRHDDPAYLPECPIRLRTIEEVRGAP
jgi:hypothetical protein